MTLIVTGHDATIDFGNGPIRIGRVSFGPNLEDIYRTRYGRLPGSTRTSRLRKKRAKLVRERLKVVSKRVLPEWGRWVNEDRWQYTIIDDIRICQTDFHS